MDTQLSSLQIQLLQEHGLMGGFTPAECFALLRTAKVRTYRRGELLFARKSIADEMAWILEGSARLLLTCGKQEFEVMRLGPGAAIGFIPFIAHERHLCSTQAINDTTVLALDREHFTQAARRRDPLYSRLQMALAAGAIKRTTALERAIGL